MHAQYHDITRDAIGNLSNQVQITENIGVRIGVLVSKKAKKYLKQGGL